MMQNYLIPASCDELGLSLLVCEPQTAPKGSVQLVHGMCEHKERYIPFMEFLCANGYVCIIHDHRGHGESARQMGELGYMRKGGWKALVEDTKVVADWINNKYPLIPHHLFGHSMGSMAVRSFTKRYDSLIDSLFVCGSPSDNPVKGLGKVLAQAIALICGEKSRPKLLQNMVCGSFNKSFASEGWPCAWVCSDPQILKEYHNDPLCMFQFTANGFVALLSLMQDCYSSKDWKLSKPDLPVHFISGQYDPCAVSEKDLRKAVEAVRKVGYTAVDLKIYPSMRHEILNETHKEEVWNDVLKQLSNG